MYWSSVTAKVVKGKTQEKLTASREPHGTAPGQRKKSEKEPGKKPGLLGGKTPIVPGREALALWFGRKNWRRAGKKKPKNPVKRAKKRRDSFWEAGRMFLARQVEFRSEERKCGEKKGGVDTKGKKKRVSSNSAVYKGFRPRSGRVRKRG